LIYRPEIDGLRAVAVLSVIISHAGLGWIPGGFAGVDVFFVISGFLITSIISRDLRLGRFTFTGFYARRALRILPALFCMSTTVSILAWLTLSPSQIQDLSGSVFFSVLSLSNLYFIDFVDYFAPSSEYVMLLHTWSLGVEEQFYLLFPVIAFVSYRFFGKPGFWAVVLTLAFGSFAISEWGWRNEPQGNYFFSPSRFWEILIGAVAALWCELRPNKGNDPIAVSGLLALLLTFFTYDDSMLFPSYYALVPTIGTALVLMFGRSATTTSQLLQYDPLRFIGLISFSAYLWHQPVFVFARLNGYETTSPLIAAVLISIILFLSTLSWHFIEQPFRADRIYTISWRAPTLWISGISLISLSLTGYFSSLPLLRFNEADQRLVSITRLDARDYQRSIDDGYLRQPFSKQGLKPKVAIIGDSYSRDFMNILNERGLLEELDTSVWQIANVCAPFFLGDETEASLRHIWDRIECADYDRYKSSEMLAAIADADVILLASAWQSWHPPYITETIKKLKDNFQSPILLVGPKSFGAVSTRRLLSISSPQRSKFRSDPNEKLIIANDLIKQNEGITFIDILGSFCEPDGGCPQVTASGHLISEDGRHLTQPGAIAIGDVLSENYNLRALFRLTKR